MTTLDDFDPTEPKKPTKNPGRLKDFLIRWNVTKTALTDRRGFPVSNAIAFKAMKFIELGKLRQIDSEPQISGISSEEWTCDPLPGNKTTYNITIREFADYVEAACSCQWCCMKDRTCSHILAILINTDRHNKRRFVKGRLRTT